jgi:hypothetical protein
MSNLPLKSVHWITGSASGGVCLTRCPWAWVISHTRCHCTYLLTCSLLLRSAVCAARSSCVCLFSLASRSILSCCPCGYCYCFPSTIVTYTDFYFLDRGSVSFPFAQTHGPTYVIYTGRSVNRSISIVLHVCLKTNRQPIHAYMHTCSRSIPYKWGIAAPVCICNVVLYSCIYVCVFHRAT